MVRTSEVPRVLVVDDEPLIRWSLAETLADQGYVVEEAGDGRSALRALSETSAGFDVVVLDLRLPDSNDLRLLSSIRGLRPALPVILMTAYGTPDVIQRAIDMGAFRVVHKPFEVHDLAALVAQAHTSR
ncbi:MAG TPA: response regulator [Vicinamibacterales bacterium]|nr:response regulator [Vicinamibacterales bacterium]